MDFPQVALESKMFAKLAVLEDQDVLIHAIRMLHSPQGKALQTAPRNRYELSRFDHQFIVHFHHENLETARLVLVPPKRKA
jgi:hypothetical protein